MFNSLGFDCFLQMQKKKKKKKRLQNLLDGKLALINVLLHKKTTLYMPCYIYKLTYIMPTYTRFRLTYFDSFYFLQYLGRILFWCILNSLKQRTSLEQL